jgi:hypothetical protein
MLAENGWNLATTEIVFPLQAAVAAHGGTATGYWLYFNNPTPATTAAAYTPPAKRRQALSLDDQVSLHGCPAPFGTFTTIQLRQRDYGNGYQVYVFDRTGDSSAYGRVRITDDNTNTIVFDKSYGDLGGSCCNDLAWRSLIDDFAITSTRFTVFIESREFSGTTRLFGCRAFSTSNPTSVGSTTRSYEVRAIDRLTARLCGR